MKVSQVMQQKVDYVAPNATIAEVAHLIFGRGINGVPVCKGKKLVGMITEQDILDHFYPSMQEYVEDFTHARDFEVMEEKVKEILQLSAERVMNKDVTTVKAETPLLRAQSLMKVRDIGRLPVVDERENLIGIIAKGDIFRAMVSGSLQLGEEEKFYDWLARHYDILIDWRLRLNKELPDLVRLFQKEKAKRVVDVASGTGEHIIALAKKGYEVIGLEASKLIYEISEKKRKELSPVVRSRVQFLHGNYSDIIGELPKDLDAAIFMGNALPHVMYTNRHIVQEVAEHLNPRKSFFVFQLINLHQLFTEQSGFQDFVVRDLGSGGKGQYAFLGFYTKGKGKTLIYTRAILELEGDKWGFRGVNSTPVTHVKKDELISMLRKLGFSQITLYGGDKWFHYDYLFRKPFNLRESGVLNIIAKR